MSGNDLTAFIGNTLALVAPVVLTVIVGGILVLSVLAGVVAWMDRAR